MEKEDPTIEDCSSVEDVTGDDSEHDGDMEEFTKKLQDKLEKYKIAVAVEEEAELKNRYRTQRDLQCTRHVEHIKMLEGTVREMKMNLITTFEREYPNAFQEHYSFSTDEQLEYYQTLCRWHKDLDVDQ